VKKPTPLESLLGTSTPPRRPVAVAGDTSEGGRQPVAFASLSLEFRSRGKPRRLPNDTGIRLRRDSERSDRSARHPQCQVVRRTPRTQSLSALRLAVVQTFREHIVMITLIEALGYRSLRYVRQELGPFHALVGPNASGKTTFLDVVAFLGDLITVGPEQAVSMRSDDLHDLTWGRTGERFELAIEAEISEAHRKLLQGPFTSIRYEVAVGVDPATAEIGILGEKVFLKGASRPGKQTRINFPHVPTVPTTILSPKTIPKSAGPSRVVLNKVPRGNDNFYAETYEEKGKGWVPAVKFGPRRSALGNIPAEDEKFPVSFALRELLTEGVQKIALNSQAIQKASAPGQGRRFRLDGSNLPWVIQDLKKKSPHLFEAWIKHLQTALPDIDAIKTVERQDDHHRYLTAIYRGGLKVPSWVISDGTLRLMALTLPAYLPDLQGVLLIEEPENGIHPRAVESMIQSLSSVYNAQVLLATHSPVVLSAVDVDKILCFAKDSDGATDIVRGSDHPELGNWKGETNLGVLFAAGVLG
jgi:predicted ATPase